MSLILSNLWVSVTPSTVGFDLPEYLRTNTAREIGTGAGTSVTVPWCDSRLAPWLLTDVSATDLSNLALGSRSK